MKITALYVYPIKGLRGIALPTAQVGPQGVRYDRVFMLFQRDPETGELKLKLQVGKFPRCALFSQELYPTASAVSGGGPATSDSNFDSDSGSDSETEDGCDNEHDSRSSTVIRVRYHPPEPEPEDLDVLEVPLEPDMEELEPVKVDLYGSRANAYFMGEQYDAWFSARFGFPSTLIYLGDGRRPVLGSLSPRSLVPPLSSPGTPKTATNGNSWFSSSISSVTSYLWGGNGGNRSGAGEPDWLTFTDLAPFLVTSEASLRDLQGRIAAGLMNGAAAEKGDPECEVEVENFMYKFRPNIVVDGETAWAEDFWSELGFFSSPSSPSSWSGVPGEELLRIALTTNCGRCASINVDYRTGKPAKGELGTVLKKMMRDRRIDPGHKYAPVFGRYGFVVGPHVDRAGGFVNLAVGDDVDVTKRATERTIFDWPGMATL